MFFPVNIMSSASGSPTLFGNNQITQFTKDEPGRLGRMVNRKAEDENWRRGEGEDT